MFGRTRKALLGAGITLCASAPAVAQYRRYVALGDSFTAG